MNANEFRIGNWVKTGFGIRKVDELEDGFITVHLDAICSLSNSKCIKNGFEPIPLTEEWLLKAGAKKHKKCFEINRLAISYIPLEKKWAVTNFDFGYFYTTIQYVHELQNLVFALDKIELTFQ